MGSSRLPGKVMREISGRPLLGHLLDRLSLCKSLDSVVVATSTYPENDVIEMFCRRERIPCFRGSEEDVLGRTVGALESVSATIGVEVFGDCPIIDPNIVDEIVNYFIANPGYDFVGNDLKTSYPPGMEVEVFGLEALKNSSQRLPNLHRDREHGTLFIRQNPDIYRIMNLEASDAHRRPELSLEVDTLEDLEVISAIITHFEGRLDYSLSEIIDFMEVNSELAAINKNVPRRWKQYRD